MNDRTPLIQLKGIGEKSRALFQKLEIDTVGDLIRHYPRDYESFLPPVPISEAEPGMTAAVRGCVEGIPSFRRVRNLSILNVNVRDASGSMQLTYYNMPYMRSVLKTGSFHIFRGLVQTRGKRKLMEQPRLFGESDYAALIRCIQPKYALTKGLSNQAVQKAVKQALEQYEFGEEAYPEWITAGYELASFRDAVCGIHFPKDERTLARARKRLVFDEFFQFLLLLQKNRDLREELPNRYPMRRTDAADALLEKLPFALTGAQRRAWEEIRRDLEGPFCMNRLIQGDVGSGKTIIALLALLSCACSGYQGAMMAPTEVLARQHYETVCSYIEKYGLPLKPLLLVGSMTAKEKREAYGRIADGEADLILGTHALIQEKVNFRALALVVTDEQHRFGVRHRELLAGKGLSPHILVMSATPIPRTLAMILYGDLHISVIDELPANRLPVKNCVVNSSYRPKAYSFIAGQAAEGHQAYVICPMVEEGEMEGLENVVEYTGKLRAALPPQIRCEYLHGRMRPADKNRIMEAFARGEIAVLVSTTVIEVGINVPNATVMMVENAERFGLAQLHQLRGRVGRGDSQSYCIFISTKEDKETMERLNILNHSNDGFHIASEDLRLRGPGDLFGVRQSGDFAFRMGDIYADASVLMQASEAVKELMARDPSLTLPENERLREHIGHFARESVDFRTI